MIFFKFCTIKIVRTSGFVNIFYIPEKLTNHTSVYSIWCTTCTYIQYIVITLTVVSNWLIDCIILYRWGQWPQKYKCTQVNDPKVQTIQNIHWFSVNLPLKNVHGCFLVLCCDVSSDNFGCENAGSRPRQCTYR